MKVENFYKNDDLHDSTNHGDDLPVAETKTPKTRATRTKTTTAKTTTKKVAAKKPRTKKATITAENEKLENKAKAPRKRAASTKTVKAKTEADANSELAKAIKALEIIRNSVLNDAVKLNQIDAIEEALKADQKAKKVSARKTTTRRKAKVTEVSENSANAEVATDEETLAVKKVAKPKTKRVTKAKTEATTKTKAVKAKAPKKVEVKEIEASAPKESQSKNNELVESAQKIWKSIEPRLRSILGLGDFKAWIAPLKAYKSSDAVVYFTSANAFACSRIRTEYLHRLQSVWNDFDPLRRRIVVEAPKINKTKKEKDANLVEKTEATEETQTPSPVSPFHFIPAGENVINLADVFTYKSNDKTFENFETGSSNQVAAAVAKRIAEETSGGEVIYFHGLNGVGKTHLLSAIAHYSTNYVQNRRILSLTSQTFLNMFQAALRDRQTTRFKEGLRNADLLLVDDIQMICGKSATQDEFFQTMLDLIHMGKTVVCTADVPPEALDGITPRMKNILTGGFNVRIEEPDFELRKKIAMRKVSEFAKKRPDFVPPEKALDLIAARAIGSGRSVEGAVKHIFASSALIGQEATMEVVAEAIGERFVTPSKTIPVETIKKRVAAHYDVSLEDLIGTKRHAAIARPRQIVMYLCKKYTKRSYPDIAARMGGRDHTTVMHAVKRITKLMETNPKFAEEMQIITNKILNG